MGTSSRAPNDFIVLPIKLSPAKNVAPDFDFGRRNINFQGNYTCPLEGMAYLGWRSPSEPGSGLICR